MRATPDVRKSGHFVWPFKQGIHYLCYTDQSPVQRQRSVRSLFDKQPFPMDILVYTPAEFDKQKNWLNNIINIAVKTGKLVYERSN